MTLYKKGMQFNCPHCGEDSVVKLKTEMDGWTKVGEYLACALCDAKLDEPQPTDNADESSTTSEGASKLMDFLGTGNVEKEIIIEDDGTRKFCRDCNHLLEHPFKVYCLLHNKDVNPMDDCDNFERKEK